MKSAAIMSFKSIVVALHSFTHPECAVFPHIVCWRLVAWCSRQACTRSCKDQCLATDMFWQLGWEAKVRNFGCQVLIEKDVTPERE